MHYSPSTTRSTSLGIRKHQSDTAGQQVICVTVTPLFHNPYQGTGALLGGLPCGSCCYLVPGGVSKAAILPSSQLQTRRCA